MKKFIFYIISFTLIFTLSLPINSVYADGDNKMFSVELNGMVLETDFEDGSVYVVQSSSEQNESVDIFDVKSHEKLASLSLNFANPNSRLESAGSYRKYLANGLTIVHAFGYTYTTSGNKKVLSKITWDETSADGWSLFKKISGSNTVSLVNSGKVSGSYNIVIQASVTSSVTVEIEKTLKLLKFGGSISVGSTYYGTKSFQGGWTLSINPTSTPPCELVGNQWICPYSS